MDPEAFAKQRFEQYDTNKDGQLDPTEAEASSRLRESYKEVDTDRNGLISLAEYTQYIRMRFASGGPGGPGGNPNDPNANPWGQPGFYVPVVPEQKKVAVYRFGSLPKDLPEWFSKIDADKDAQVGLYEWRKAGRDLAEFRSFDLNGDGFINGFSPVGGCNFTAIGPTAIAVEPECVNVRDKATIRSSVGASILWNSPLGPIRFDYAYALTKDEGLNTGFGKVGKDQTQAFRFSGGSRF